MVGIRDGERCVSPVEVSAEILRKLKSDAERAVGATIDRAVITVPAYFNDAQRQATRAAGELAGFVVERILNEPTAAALAYGLERLGERSRVAVYDLGGGTFDISILEMSEGVFRVLSTTGHTRLGGDDFDVALERHLCVRGGLTLGEGELAKGLSRARLRAEVVRVKHDLSAAERVAFRVPFLSEVRGSLEFMVERSEFDAVIHPWLEQTRGLCLRALADAGLAPADLSAVVLVGGSTRIPAVRRLVAEIFGREPDITQHPDEAVAVGATLQAGILEGTVREALLLDVTPLSLGVETYGGLMNVIIPRNSSIPCKAGELFTNALAGQRSMSVRVLQGERELANDNWELGRFEIPFEAAEKGKARVGVQFEIDVNGVLAVLARDVGTGRQVEVRMASAVDVSDEAVEKMLEDSLEHAFEDMAARVWTEARMKAEEMLPAVDAAMGMVGAELDTAERGEVEAALAGVRAALGGGRGDVLKAATQRLDDATQRLATLMVLRVSGR
jgi:molecular chaperone DnaK